LCLSHSKTDRQKVLLFSSFSDVYPFHKQALIIQTIPHCCCSRTLSTLLFASFWIFSEFNHFQRDSAEIQEIIKIGFAKSNPFARPFPDRNGAFFEKLKNV